MNRRELFQALIGVSAVGAVCQPTQAVERKYGLLTVQGWRAHQATTGEELAVFLDGLELQHVYEANDVEGYALVFCRDAEQHRDWTKAGHLHVRGDGACRLRLTGHVSIRPKGQK